MRQAAVLAVGILCVLATARQAYLVNAQAPAAPSQALADIRRTVMVAYAYSHSIAVTMIWAEQFCPAAASGAASQQRSEDLINFMAIAKREYDYLAIKLNEMAALTGRSEERQFLSYQLAASIRGAGMA